MKCIECADGFYEDMDGQCTPESCRTKDIWGMCIECNTRGSLELRTQGEICVLQCTTPWKQADDEDCELDCEDGWYPGLTKCLKCNVEGCKTCSIDGICTECLEDYGECALTCGGDDYIHDYFDQGKCVDSCDMPNTYESNEEVGVFKTPYCGVCDEDCLECKQGLFGPVCVKCTEGEFGFLLGCEATCPDGTFIEGSVCSVCIEGCESCNNPTTCDTCTSGLNPVDDGFGNTIECFDECPLGSYVHTNNNCYSCDETPSG